MAERGAEAPSEPKATPEAQTFLDRERLDARMDRLRTVEVALARRTPVVFGQCITEQGYDRACDAEHREAPEEPQPGEDREPEPEEGEEGVEDPAPALCPDRAEDDRRYSACIDDRGD